MENGTFSKREGFLEAMVTEYKRLDVSRDGETLAFARPTSVDRE